MKLSDRCSVLPNSSCSNQPQLRLGNRIDRHDITHMLQIYKTKIFLSRSMSQAVRALPTATAIADNGCSRSAWASPVSEEPPLSEQADGKCSVEFIHWTVSVSYLMSMEMISGNLWPIQGVLMAADDCGNRNQIGHWMIKLWLELDKAR